MLNFGSVSFAFWHPAFVAWETALRFGNLIETMISLWSAVSGGNDWMNYGELLRCGKFKWWSFDWNLENMFGIEMEILHLSFIYSRFEKQSNRSPKSN